MKILLLGKNYFFHLKKHNKKLLKNKFIFFSSKNWNNSLIRFHNSKIGQEKNFCILTKKKKSIMSYSNISRRCFKKIINLGKLSNLKKSTW